MSARPATEDRRIALVLQGGGALGSYQAGAHEALAEAGYRPDWVAGISIGAVNGAIIAGNAPEDRTERLREFWRRVSGSPFDGLLRYGPAMTSRWWGAFHAAAFGQAGFFKPSPPTPGSTGHYDSSALRETLLELVDFERINTGPTRLAVGATDVENGDFVYFDSRHHPLRVEHILASAALPQAFPPVEIDGRRYWDGGLVSNTPLQYVIDYVPRRSLLAFEIDLFNPMGPRPEHIGDVVEREKDIRYASRSRAATDMYRVIHDVRHNINALLEKLPPDLRRSAEAEFLYEFGCVTRMDVARLTYRPAERQGWFKDFEFSRECVEARWRQGAADATAAIAESPWLEPMPDRLGARVFDLPAHGVEAREHTTLSGDRREPGANGRHERKS